MKLYFYSHSYISITILCIYIIRDKAKYNEMCQNLKSEIGDLHGMLDAMEHATQDAELRHANAVELVKEVHKFLQNAFSSLEKLCYIGASLCSIFDCS